MNDTNPPQEREATDPKEARKRQLMASLLREVPEESSDDEPSDSGRVRLTEGELECRAAAYRQYRAMRRPLLPRRFDEGRGGRKLSR